MSSLADAELQPDPNRHEPHRRKRHFTATKTWDNLNRLYRIQSTSTATVGGLSQTFTYGYNVSV